MLRVRVIGGFSYRRLTACLGSKCQKFKSYQSSMSHGFTLSEFELSRVRISGI